MAEFEELKLTVNLVDDASTGLANIRTQLTQLIQTAGQVQTAFSSVSVSTQQVGNAAVQAAPRIASAERSLKDLSNAAGETTRGMLQMALSMRGGITAFPQLALGAREATAGLSSVSQGLESLAPASRVAVLAMGAVAIGVTAVTAAVGAFGFTVFRFAREMSLINDTAKTLGTSFADLKNAIDVAEKFDVAAETVIKNFNGIAQAQANLSQNNSSMRHRLLGMGVDANFLAQVQQEQDPTKVQNMIRERGLMIQRQLQGRGWTGAAARAQINQFAGEFGQDAGIYDRPAQKEMSKEQRETYESVGKQSAKISEVWGDIYHDVKMIGIEVANWGMPMVLSTLEGIKSVFETISDTVKEIKAEFKGIWDSIPDWAKNVFRGMANPSFGEDKKALEWLLPGTHPTHPNAAQPRRPTEFGVPTPGGVAGGMMGLPQSYHPSGSDVGPGTGIGAGATPTKGPVTLGKGEDPRGMEGHIRETAAKYGIDPDTAVRVAKSEGLRDFSGDHGKSGGAFQLYTGGGLGNEFQKQTGLDPLDPKNEKATIDFALKRASTGGWGPWHGAARVGIGPREGLPGSGMASLPATGRLAETGSVPHDVMLQARELALKGGSSGEVQQFMAAKGYPKAGAWCGEFTASVVKQAGGTPPKGAAVASNWLNWGQHVDPTDVHEGDVMVRKVSRYGGMAAPGQTGSHVALVGNVGDASVERIGGNQRAGSVQQSRYSGEYEYRRGIPDREALDRRVVDRQNGSTINSTGNLSVDVRAPAGTKVNYDGNNLLKATSMQRSTAMQQTPSGPNASDTARAYMGGS